MAPRRDYRRSLLASNRRLSQQSLTNSGYSYPDGAAPSDPQQLVRPGMMDFIGTKWAKAFFVTTAIQAIICLTFEAYIFALFEINVSQKLDTQTQYTSFFRSIPTFLTLFIFAFLYELVLVWDALRLKNTIQVIGVCIANLAFLIYTAIQIEQIDLAITKLSSIQAVKHFNSGTLWSRCRPYLIAIPCVIGLGTIFMGFIAWKLYQVFAWDILKQIGADYRMKKRFLHYQIYIALLKFDFFFFLGFTVQFLVIVTGKTDIEFGLTAAAIPITIVILLLGAYFTRNEIKIGMIISIGLYICSLAWFFFKLVRIYEPGFKHHYEAVQKSLTAFAVLAIILIILTITNAFICMHNFGSGLKNHILRRDAPDEKVQYVNDTIGLNDIKPVALPTRMTID